MRQSLFYGTALSMAVLIIPSALAQSAGNGGTAPPTRSQKLETVTVTAERKVANVQKTAISISTISGRTITATAQTTIADVLQQVPALTVAGDAHGSQISIRGVGSNGDSNFIDSDVTMMYDDVYNGRAEGGSTAMYDVNRVEVLRGPQGTLYGRNAAGGVVNILSNDPSLAKFAGGVNFSYGNYDLRHADGFVNVPITDVLAIRGAADVTRRNGYINNGGFGDHAAGYRVKLLYQPNSDFSAIGTIDYWHQTGLGNSTVSAANPVDYGGFPPFFNWPVNKKDPWTQLDSDHPADTDNYKFVTYSLHVNYALGDIAQITFIPSYSYNSRFELSNLVTGDTPQIDSTLSGGSYQDKQFTGELRVSNAKGSRVTWVAGLYYLHDENFGSAAGETTTVTAGQWYRQFGENAPTSSKAVFAQVTYPVTDKFRVTGGLRYTEDQKEIGFGVCTTVISSLTCTSPSSSYYYYLPEVNYSAKYDALTYKAGVEYDLTPTAMGYAQVSSGYKAGGFSTNAYPPVSYEPEKITAYELGLKSRWLDDTLQINAEAYYYKYRNLQIQYSFNGCPPVPPSVADAAAAAGGTGSFCAADTGAYAAGDQGPFLQYVTNAASSFNTGLEAEMKWRFTPEDEFDFSPTYLDARYGAFNADTGLTYLKGRPVIENPKFTFLAAYQHDFELPDGTLTLHGDVKYSTGYYLNVAETSNGGFPGEYDYQNCFFIENANLTYVPVNNRYSVTLWGKNLADKAAKDFAFPLGRVMLNDPRTFGATVSYKF